MGQKNMISAPENGPFMLQNPENGPFMLPNAGPENGPFMPNLGGGGGGGAPLPPHRNPSTWMKLKEPPFEEPLYIATAIWQVITAPFRFVRWMSSLVLRAIVWTVRTIWSCIVYTVETVWTCIVFSAEALWRSIVYLAKASWEMAKIGWKWLTYL